MRCDRCGELEVALFRAGDVGWYCEGCMEETGHTEQNELAELVKFLKQYHEENQ